VACDTDSRARTHANPFREVRELYGETQVQFARRCGWTGSDATLKRKVIRYENGETPLVGTVAALIAILREVKGDTRRTRNRTSTKGKA
jgi:transcriptional regulator with XRE-family HTH domain